MDKIIARLTIQDAETMTKERRQEIAQWLRENAKSILKDGDKYSKRFISRFII